MWCTSSAKTAAATTLPLLSAPATATGTAGLSDQDA